MLNQSIIIPENQGIFLLKSDFHQLNSLIQAHDRIFEIKICSKSFFFSKEQIIILSLKVFLFISQNKQSYHISVPPNISEDLLVSCFDNLFSLFFEKSEIFISQNTTSAFQYLSQVLENQSLFSICEIVKSSDIPQQFFLTSESFGQIPRSILDSLNDFTILLNGIEINCNIIFASLISHKILNQIKHSKSSSFIDFSYYPNSAIIQILFSILQGYIIKIDASNIDQISDALYFLEFNSISIDTFIEQFSFNFASNDLSSLISLSKDSIQKIITSYFLHIKNENQLFEFIMNLIKENRKYLIFMKYILFGLVDFSHLMNLINFVQFHEINFSLFNSLKSSFKQNYFLSFGIHTHSENIQSILQFSKSLEDILRLKKQTKI
jgi:hypothetical protein